MCFAHCVPLAADSLPNDIATLKAMVIAAELKAQNAEAEKTPTAASGGEIDDLKRQLDEMQKRIEKLSDSKTTT